MDVSKARILVTLLGLTLVSSTLLVAPAAGAAPQPVVAIDDDGDDGSQDATPDEAPVEPPAPWEQSEYICSDGVTGSGLASPSTTTSTEVLSSTGYPAPVVAIEGGESGDTVPPAPPVIPCSAAIRLRLTIRAPSGQRPHGVDAILDGIPIPQSTLEGGFDIDLRAEDHSITLPSPGPDWELTETSCTCTRALASAGITVAGVGLGSLVMSGYPRPVVAVGGSPQNIACGGATASSDSATASSPASAAAFPAGSFGARSPMSAAPQPVVAVDPGPLSDLDFVPPASMSWSADGRIGISDQQGAGGTFICEWVIEWAYGDLSIETVTEPPGEEGRFSYRITPSFSEPPAGPITLGGSPGSAAELRKGSWSIDVLGQGGGWGVTESDCDELDGRLPSAAAGSAGTAGIDAMDDVRCRFVLELQTLMPGRWIADNRRGVFACTNVPALPVFRLPAKTQRGTISLRQGGEVLVAVGLSDGGGTIRLRRDADDPLIYRGRVNIPGADARLRFNVTLRVIDATHARADLKATFRYAGSRCTADRRVILTHASAR